MNDKKLISLGPMSRRLRVHPRWLRVEAEAGNLPCVRAGPGFLFDGDLIEKVLLERAQCMPGDGKGR